MRIRVIMADFDPFSNDTHLFLGVTELGQVVDAVEHSAFVSNAGVEIVLLAILVNAQAFEHQPLGEPRLHRADLEDGIHV